ncbi:MAG TPA: EMC3/TMCO1 family protein [Candidatus Saccharimonadales bacterium]|nr:EMC3/TMCO1 family protein [Candidatus Saccharimonadales bacterium]
MISLAIQLLAVAVAYGAFSIVLQRKLINVDRMYEIRARMNQGTKHLTDMMKANADKAAISEKQKEIMDISSESMKLQFKPLIIIFPIFLLLYYVVLPLHFNMAATLTVASVTLSYHWFFVGALFIIGIILSTAFSIYDRKRLKEKYNFGLMQPSFKTEQPAS